MSVLSAPAAGARQESVYAWIPAWFFRLVIAGVSIPGVVLRETLFLKALVLRDGRLGSRID
jgi:hypothetical protein